MTRFWNRITVWSSLYEPVLIYGSSHGSVFESPAYRVHNEHESGPGPGLTKRVWTAATCNPTNEHTQTYTVHIPTHARYTCIRTHVHPHMYIYTSIHIYTQSYACIYTERHTCVHTSPTAYIKHTHALTPTSTLVYRCSWRPLS